MNNSVFCKTKEDVEKHTYVKLVTDCKKHNKLVAKLYVDQDVIFDQN